MKKYTVVNIIILIAGIILLGVGSVLGASDSYYMSWFNPISYTETFDEDKDISKIEIDAAFCNMDIYSGGDDFILEADEVPLNFKLIFSESNGILKIKPEKRVKISLPMNSGRFGTYKLYIPEKYYDELELDCSFSDITVDTLSKFDNISLDISFSEFSFIQLSETTKLSVESAFSGISIGMDGIETEINHVSVDNTFGSFSLKGAYVSDRMSIDNAFGECSIKLTGNNYNIKKSNAFGDISYSGDFDRNSGSTVISADNSFGSIRIYN